MNPEKLAIVFVIPMRTPENLGAMSMWLMRTPDKANPEKPTVRVRKRMAINLSLPRYPVKISPAAPPQNAVRILPIHKLQICVDCYRNTFFRT